MTKQDEILNKIETDMKIEIKKIKIGDWVNRDIQTEIKKIRQHGGLYEDYIEILRSEAIQNYTTHHKIKKAILPEIAEVLSSRALNLLCKSRGSELAKACGAKFAINDLLVGRPLFEINLREIQFFAKSHNLFQYVLNDSRTFEKNVQKIFTGKGYERVVGEGSIGILLDEFVSDLQGEYQSTCATLLKTVQKLDFGGEESSCGSCGASYDREKDLAKMVGVVRNEEEVEMCSACLIMFDKLNY